MLLFLIFNLLFFYRKYVTKGYKKLYQLDIIFGFYSGGNYSFILTKGGINSLLFMVGLKKDFKKFEDTDTLNFLCKNDLSYQNFHFMTLINGEGEVTGTVKQKGEYKFQIYSCIENSTTFNLNLTLVNPGTRLSYTTYQYVKTVFIISIVFSILLLIWLINWFLNFSFQNSLHIIITVFFVLYVLNKWLVTFDYRHRNKEDSVAPVTVVQVFSDTLCILFSSLVIIFTLDDQIEAHKRLKYFIKCLAFPVIICSFTPIILYFTDKSSSSIVILTFCGFFRIFWLIYIIFSLICCFEICQLCSNISSTIMFVVILIYIVDDCIKLFFIYNQIIVKYVYLLITDIFDMICFVAFGFIFRMTRETKENYSSIYLFSGSKAQVSNSHFYEEEEEENSEEQSQQENPDHVTQIINYEDNEIYQSVYANNLNIQPIDYYGIQKSTESSSIIVKKPEESDSST